MTRRDPHLRVYDAASGELLQDIPLDSDHTDFAFVGGGLRLLVVDSSGNISEWELASGERVRQYLSLAGTLRNCAGGVTPWR